MLFSSVKLEIKDEYNVGFTQVLSRCWYSVKDALRLLLNQNEGYFYICFVEVSSINQMKIAIEAPSSHVTIRFSSKSNFFAPRFSLGSCFICNFLIRKPYMNKATAEITSHPSWSKRGKYHKKWPCSWKYFLLGKVIKFLPGLIKKNNPKTKTSKQNRKSCKEGELWAVLVTIFSSSLMSQVASEIHPFLVQQCTEPSHLALADHYLDGQLPTPSLRVVKHLTPHYG